MNKHDRVQIPQINKHIHFVETITLSILYDMRQQWCWWR